MANTDTYLTLDQKFWAIRTEGGKTFTRFGKLGAQGQTTLKDYGSDADAEKNAAKLIAAKKKGGYKESVEGGKPKTADVKSDGGEVTDEDKEEEEEEEETPAKKRKAPAAAKKAPAKKAPAKAKGSTKSSSLLKDMVICQTGTMSVSRAEMDALIKNNGGTPISSLTKKCTHLLVGVMPATATAKMQKAEEQGATVISEDDLRKMLGGADAGDNPADDDGEEEDNEEDEEENEEAPPPKKQKTAAKKAAPAKSSKKEKSDGGHSSSALKDMVICQTGTMSISRKEMDDFITENGGTPVSTLTKKCTHLLVGVMPAEATAKMQKAEEQGSTVITEADLMQLVEGADE